MKDKDILNILGIDSKTITLNLTDEYTQVILEQKIDDYLKKLEEEKKKEKTIDFLKDEYNNYSLKQNYIDMFNDSYVYKRIKDKLIRDGFIYRCPFCLDVSNQYAKCNKK